MVYSAILSIPKISSCIFENEEKVEPIFKIFYGIYPLDLQIISMNFLSELARHIPFQSYSRFNQDMGKIRERIIGGEGEFGKDYFCIFKKFVLNLLNTENHEDEIMQLFEQLLKEGYLREIIEVLDVNKQCEFSHGQLVTLKSDSISRKYILLPKNQYCLYREEIMNKNSQLSAAIFEATNTYTTYDMKGREYKKWPLYCPKTNKILLAEEEEFQIDNYQISGGIIDKIFDSLIKINELQDMNVETKLQLVKIISENRIVSQYLNLSYLKTNDKYLCPTDMEKRIMQREFTYSLEKSTSGEESVRYQTDKFQLLKRKVLKRNIHILKENKAGCHLRISKKINSPISQKVLLDCRFDTQYYKNAVLVKKLNFQISEIESLQNFESPIYLINLETRLMRLDNDSVDFKKLAVRRDVIIDKIIHNQQFILDLFQICQKSNRNNLARIRLLTKIVEKASTTEILQKYAQLTIDQISQIVQSKIDFQNGISVKIFVSWCKLFRDVVRKLELFKKQPTLNYQQDTLDYIFERCNFMNPDHFIFWYSVDCDEISSIFFNLTLNILVRTNSSKPIDVPASLTKSVDFMKFNYKLIAQTDKETLQKYIIRAGAYLVATQEQKYDLIKPFGYHKKVEFMDLQGAKIELPKKYRNWIVTGAKDLGIITLSTDIEGENIIGGLSHIIENGPHDINSRYRLRETSVSLKENKPVYLHWRKETDFYFTNKVRIPKYFNTIASSDYKGPNNYIYSCDEMVLGGKLIRFSEQTYSYLTIDAGYDHWIHRTGYKRELDEICIVSTYYAVQRNSDYRQNIQMIQTDDTISSENIAQYGKVKKLVGINNPSMKNVACLLESGKILFIQTFHLCNEQNILLFKNIKNQDKYEDHPRNSGEVRFFLYEKSRIEDFAFTLNQYALARRARNGYLYIQQFSPKGLETAKCLKSSKLKKIFYQSYESGRDSILIVLTDDNLLYSDMDESNIKFQEFFQINSSNKWGKNQLKPVKLKIDQKGKQFRLIDISGFDNGEQMIAGYLVQGESDLRVKMINFVADTDIIKSISVHLNFLRVRLDCHFPVTFANTSLIFLNSVKPVSNSYFTNCEVREDPRLGLKNVGDLKYPFYTFYSKSEKKMIAVQLSELKEQEIQVKRVKDRLRTRRKIKKISMMFRSLKESTEKLKISKIEEENKNKTSNEKNRIKSESMLRLIPNHDYLDISTEDQPTFLAGILVKAFSNIKRRVKEYKIEKKQLDLSDKLSQQKKQEKVDKIKTHKQSKMERSKCEISFIFNRPDIEINNLFQYLTCLSRDFYKSRTSCNNISSYPNKYCVNHQDIKDQNNQDTKEFVLSFDDYFLKKEINCFGIYIEGNLPVNFIQTIPGNIKTHSFLKNNEITEISFYPDIYNLNEREFQAFMKESESLLSPLFKHYKLKDPNLQDLPSNREEIEVTLDKKMDIEFERYSETIVQKMKNQRRKNRLTNVPIMINCLPQYITEFYDLYENNNHDWFDVNLLPYFTRGIFWLNHKIWLNQIHNPVTDGLYWEDDLFPQIKGLYCKNLVYTMNTFYSEMTPQFRIDRFNSEKSTYTNQQQTLLHQYFDRSMSFSQFNLKKCMIRFIDYLRFEFNRERTLYLYQPQAGIDAGGPAREYFYLLSEEILTKLKMFVPSPNQLENIGKERDKVIPDINAISITDKHNFYKFGFLLAQLYKHSEIINVNLPTILMKYLLNQEISWKDFSSINQGICSYLEGIDNVKEEEFEYMGEMYFVVQFGDKTEYELIQNGKNILLTFQNKYEYINLIKQTYLNLLIEKFELIKKGFYETMPSASMKFVHHTVLRDELIGLSTVDLSQLRKITKYVNFEEHHEEAQRFWRVLETFNQQQLGMYLKYVWGRSRLNAGVSNVHKLEFMNERIGIPMAHTCFFSLDLGIYESDKELRDLLILGIENCNEIAEDDAHYNLEADFGISKVGQNWVYQTAFSLSFFKRNI